MSSLLVEDDRDREVEDGEVANYVSGDEAVVAKRKVTLKRDRALFESDDFREPHASEPLRSAEGYVVIVTNLSASIAAADIREIFEDYGAIQSLHCNKDRRTGLTKSYAMLLYNDRLEAERAINGGDGMEIDGRKVSVDWAFREPPVSASRLDDSHSQTGHRRRRYD